MKKAKSVKGKTEEKKKRQPKPKPVSENFCFCCSEGGDLFVCDSPKCGKVYHLKCLKRTDIPKGSTIYRDDLLDLRLIVIFIDRQMDLPLASLRRLRPQVE